MTEAQTHPPPTDERLEGALEAAFARETRRGVLLMAIFQALLFGIPLAIRVIDIVNRFHTPWQWLQDMALAINLAMTITAMAAYVLALQSRRPLIYAYLLILLGVVSTAQSAFLFPWRPPAMTVWPTFLAVRFQDVQGVAVILGACALPLSRTLSIRAGAIAAVLWPAAVIVAFATFPGASPFLGGMGPGLGEAGLARMSHPYVLIPDYLAIQMVLLAAFAALLVAAVDQSHRYVVARTRTEVDLAFLRRLLPSDVAERVALTGDAPVAGGRRRVAVLFVGHHGRDDAASDLDALRAQFAQVETAAFAHGGLVDRFTGGPIMVTFGALDPAPDAARRAIDCCRALSGGPALSLALHVGQAVCGEAGGARSRVFSVVGDVVNTARRVLDQAGPGVALATDEVVKALGAVPQTSWLSPQGEVFLRGRDGKVTLWRLA